MALHLSPLPLDLLALARAGGLVGGDWALDRIPRLSGLLAPCDAGLLLHWSAAAELRPTPAGPPQPWLMLQLQTKLPLVCQRCLEPVLVPLEVRRQFRFVGDEATAAQQDAEADEDVLALTDPLDLATLIEDELLLSLPLVPMHGECPVPLPVASDSSGADGPRPEHPFAGLRALVCGGADDSRA